VNNLSPVQFKDYTLSHKLDDDGHHVITATDKTGKDAGFLDWYHTGGEIHDVGVQDEHQRQGVATAMYNHAKELHTSNKDIPVPVHSATRTPEGDSWAKSVGGSGLDKKACTACGDEGHLASGHK
jgi:GNAT superfamily N-acetyltransferase